MTYTKLTLLVAFSLVIGGSTAHYINGPQIEYIKEVVPVPTLEQEVEARANDILVSAEFQEEVKALAKARALYALSIERQDIAVELSEQAMQSFLKSKELANNWVTYE